MNTHANITFVTGIFHIYVQDYDTINKTIEKRIEHFEKIASLGLCICVYTDDIYINLISPLESKYSNVRVYNINNIWTSEIGKTLLEYKKQSNKEIELPKVRNSLKDTKEFLLIMNMKIELVKKAMNANIFNSNYFMWFDFGIAYIFKDTSNTLEYIKSIEQMNFVNKFIHIPGCWNEKQMISFGLCDANNFNNYMKDRIMWRFCGGIILGDMQTLNDFYDISVGSYLEFFNVYNTLVWETNYWAWIEKYKNFNIDWTYADHNDGIFNIPKNIIK